MNILLVYPMYPDTFWSFKHALKFVSKKASFPPFGHLTLESVLPKDWSKKLIDMHSDELKNDVILWADIVFKSAVLIQSEAADEVIKNVNSYTQKFLKADRYSQAARNIMKWLISWLC